MAAPTSYNGNDVSIFLRTAVGPDVYKVLVCANDASLSTSKDAIESVTKCGRTSRPGIFKWEMTFSGEVDSAPDSATEVSLNELWADYVAGTVKHWGFQNADGTFGWHGNGYMTKCDISAPVDAIVTYSITVTGTGDLTKY